ncbi:MAG: pyridoxamine 5'-phosphate oxidase family protein [Candidatus Competibacteraceae bacterium]|nr:pyridoxamine 5'-phosphate oxidase family protein [Candidatus Competibacteraceae bacterium]
MSLEQSREIIKELLASQIQAVLATQSQHQPYTSLMTFAETGDLSQLLFATYRATYKYSNLMDNGRAALLIDNRTCQASDHYDGIAVTAVGSVAEVSEADRSVLLPLYLDKHPSLTDFVLAPDCALLSMQVEHYYLVSQFQNVVVLPMDR